MQLSELVYPYSVTTVVTLNGTSFHRKTSFKKISASAAKGDEFYFLNLLLNKTVRQFGR